MKKGSLMLLILLFLTILCTLYSQSNVSTSNSSGVHYLVNIDNVDDNLINDNQKLTQIIEHCLKISKVNILKKTSHEFKPQGFTLLYLLSESHFSLHTWPEKNSIRIDLFSCSGKRDCDKGISYLIKEFHNSTVNVEKVIR